MNTIAIGSRRELLIDPYLIERFEGAALRLHPPQPQDVSLACRPVRMVIELKDADLYSFVFDDGGKYDDRT